MKGLNCILILCFLITPALAQDEEFKGIKGLLQKDKLDKELEKKESERRKRQKRKVKSIKQKFKIPPLDKQWSFISEMWLIKNAQVLQWDFQKPKYGVEGFFRDLLENLGYYEKKLKILYLNTPNLAYGALPSSEGEFIFFISVPFIRTLDLSKAEISLILLQEFYRLERGYLKKKLATKELTQLAGGNFYNKKFPKKVYEAVLKNYDNFFFKNTFPLTEIFEVTQKMNKVLKSDLTSWNMYLGTLKKINQLVKNNVLYKSYNALYRSPQLQINWLVPRELNDKRPSQ